jgi:hypothetical protein
MSHHGILSILPGFLWLASWVPLLIFRMEWLRRT